MRVVGLNANNDNKKTFLHLSGFLEWVLCKSWQPLLFTPGPRTIARLLTKRQFRAKLQPAVFKLKTIVVIVHKFSKFKRILLKESGILHFPCVGFLETV